MLKPISSLVFVALAAISLFSANTGVAGLFSHKSKPSPSPSPLPSPSPSYGINAWGQQFVIPPPPVIENSLIQKIADAAGYRVKSLSRDVYVYHWGPGAFMGAQAPTGSTPLAVRVYTQASPRPVVADSPEVSDYTRRKILWTYRTDKQMSGGMLGASLYASTFPSYTKSYGDTVVELRLPEKMKFLDLRIPAGITDRFSQTGKALPPDVVQILQSKGCMCADLYCMIASSNTDACHRIATRFLAVAGVSAVAYSYSGGTVPICPDTADPDLGAAPAMIIVNPTLGSPKYAHAFATFDTPNDKFKADRVRVDSLYANAAQSTSAMLWPNYQTPLPDETAWAKQHIFGCHKGDYAEDGRPVLPDPGKAGPKIALDFSVVTPDWNHLPKVGDEGTCASCAPNQNMIGPINNTVQKVQNALVNGKKKK